ncbi:PadR family transcriptional regulator [Clostridium swellfunianum]|uniref:PadR family transcriptional regulator n=1 Tax=Clostridium swellfunianum TaxID=1367462 RepID=UPI00202FB825|nr:PadR family transcriptional regulator [Clostridium swellfunianum]
MANSTQILKGLLEGCILRIIDKNETYGYQVCEKLIQYGFREITEGSVYPILIRLEKKHLIYSVMKPSPLGPMRKYYYLENAGRTELNEFISVWGEIKENIENVLKDES